ncbi:MAG: hypothetical protein MI924_35850 [Chloroflexales bacterium]|nr:hypothetical protein [Chloroflexales bacterium]
MPVVKSAFVYAVALALMLIIVGGGIVYVTYGQGTTTPTLTIFNTAETAPCTPQAEQMTPATKRGVLIDFQIKGYSGDEIVEFYVTFEDGRIERLPELSGPFDTLNVTLPDLLRTDRGGELHLTYTPGSQWPDGCHALTAHGLSSNRMATAYLVIKQDDTPTTVGTAQLAVVNDVTETSLGTVGSLVRLHGEGFLNGEAVSVSITKPDGTVVAFPQQIPAGDSGAFVFVFKLGTLEDQPALIGDYLFTAIGMTSGFRASSMFTIETAIASASGEAQMTASILDDPLTRMNRRVQLQGEFFSPSEGITTQLVRISPPGQGVVYPKFVQYADDQGKFDIALNLDERYPVGPYVVTATGATSGKIAVTTFSLTPVAALPTALPTTISLVATATPAPPPTPTVAPGTMPPTGVIEQRAPLVVTEADFNSYLARSPEQIAPFESAVIRFVPGEVQAEFRISGSSIQVRAGLMVQDGRITLVNLQLDGPLDTLFTLEDIQPLIEQRINDPLVSRNLVVREVRVEQGQAILVFE